MSESSSHESSERPSAVGPAVLSLLLALGLAFTMTFLTASCWGGRSAGGQVPALLMLGILSFGCWIAIRGAISQMGGGGAIGNLVAFLMLIPSSIAAAAATYLVLAALGGTVWSFVKQHVR